MNAEQILSTLQKLGKPQTAAIYRRHGAGENVFGTLTSELLKLQKKIKVDHALARELWKTGNAEARILALQIADPEKLTRPEVDKMADDAPVAFLGSYLASLVARSPLADKAMRDWMKSRDEDLRRLGYELVAVRLKAAADSISDADAKKAVATIEKEIHGSPNAARGAMNMALIAVGIYKPALRANAVASAKRIGKVVVDHGDTNCKTPDAVPTIEKASKRRVAS